ncbi:MBL fold metallo-hydrolase [Maribacter luteus]|uniref:MBL fold metallo-hydrolase n=1 Tax=Maribacter luteus TaxID=2594478 RepID=A0A6I2MRL8_9FLAO|nr:MBL fold metallo-hydrolase [Maribacter luteus]MRX64854.1 MBL fold metallo-hydrolase [Maribacter luteus]
METKKTKNVRKTVGVKETVSLLFLILFILNTSLFAQEKFDIEKTKAKYASRDYVYGKLPESGFNYYKIGENAYFVHDNFEHMVFFVTDNGVVVVDPVPGVSPYTLKLIPQITDKPITHVIYSHHHADHAQGAYLYPKSAILIGNETMTDFLKAAEDPKRPLPDVTWKDQYVLETGGLRLEFKDLGRNWHSQKDIIMYAPQQKILFAIDMFHPDAAPWIHWGESSDPDFAFQLPRYLLDNYDFEFVVIGHERIIGTRFHMEQYEAQIKDMKKIVFEVAMSPEYHKLLEEITQRYHGSAAHYEYKEKIMTAAELGASKYIMNWAGKVRNVRLNAVENIQTMFMHMIVLDPPIREMQKMKGNVITH